jgi:transposase
VAHILRSSSAVVATQTGRARDFGEPLKALAQGALALWHAPRDGAVPACTVDADARQAAVTSQRRDRRLKAPDQQRRRNARGWPHERGNLLRFRRAPRIAPTTNRAERALRPAVLARRVSPCAKHDRGAQAWAAFTSVVRTLATHRVDSLVEGLDHRVRATRIHARPPYPVITIRPANQLPLF